MSIENRSRPSDVSDLQRRINEIAQLEKIESEGMHVDSLAHKIDPNLSQEIDKTHDAKTFGAKNRALTRRRTRNLGMRILRLGLKR